VKVGRPVPARFPTLALVLALGAVVRAAPVRAEEPEPAAPGAQPGKVLDIHGKVLDIVGVTLGIDAALRDLGARVTPQEIRIELAADVLFDFDKDTLRPDARDSLHEVATVIAGYPNAPVRVEGHTDSKGGDAYNQVLSERRAASVKTWLVKEGGIAASRITTQGFGETRPKVPNTKPDGSDDPEGRQKNRRVEIVVRKG
jgi:outer membrane protein OmpA-like peptidoglycan-associated protein